MSAWSARVVVIAVETIGDWIRLSIALSIFAFWFVATNLWEVPIPTLVISTATGFVFNASSAFLAILIVSSLILTTNNSSGKKVVAPTPGKLVSAIPTADVAVPTCLYWIFSPVK